MTVYTMNACPKCKILKKQLEERKISFLEINISKDFKEKAYLMSNGIMAMPCVKIGEELITNDRCDIDYLIGLEKGE